jgi:HSP20 family protein
MPLIVTSERSFHGSSRHVGKLVENMHKGYYAFSPSEVWNPNVNLYETEHSYLVCVDLAGVDKQKIDITVDNHVLKLHGHREVPHPSSGHHQRARVHLMEIDHGAFNREVELPVDVSPDHIKAHYAEGLLWIELPKR